MAACNELIRGINPNCEATRKPGGLNKRLYFGLLSDLTSVSFGTGNLVAGLTFAEDKGLVKVIGKREKHNSAMTLEVGDNFNLRNHAINAVIYYNTPDELEALDAIIDVEGAFIVAETNAGELEVWGMNKGANFQNFGLKAATIEGGSGTAITDSNIYTLGLTGNHENLQLYFDSSTEMAPATLAQNIAVLDALTVWPPQPTPDPEP
jgi:hypothetical protein